MTKKAQIKKSVKKTKRVPAVKIEVRVKTRAPRTTVAVRKKRIGTPKARAVTKRTIKKPLPPVAVEPQEKPVPHPATGLSPSAQADQEVLITQTREIEEFRREQKQLEELEQQKVLEREQSLTEKDAAPASVSGDLAPLPVEKSKRKKRRFWIWLLLLLLLGFGLLGYHFILQPYLQARQTGQAVTAAVVRLKPQVQGWLTVASLSGHAAQFKAAGTVQTGLSTGQVPSPFAPAAPVAQNPAVPKTGAELAAEALNDTFVFRPMTEYPIQLGDLKVVFSLQKLTPVEKPVVTALPTAAPTLEPTAVPEAVVPEKKSENPVIDVLEIKAKPRSVPLGGQTTITAVIATADKDKIKKVIWSSDNGTILKQEGFTAVWQAPNRKGKFRIICTILAKDGRQVIRHLWLFTSQNVYVADVQNHCIQKFNSQGKFLFKFGKEGSGPSEFNNPNSVAVDSSRNVWVVDTGNHRIQKFTPEGKFLLTFGKQGTGDGEFQEPYAIAIDPKDNIYVAEFIGNRIQKFDSKGNYLLQFGGSGTAPGEFNNPSGIYIDANTSNLYVSDMKNHRVQKFNPRGKFIMQFGSKGAGKGQFNSPVGIAIDSRSNIYVVDQVNHRIQKFNQNGKYLLWFGGEGSDPGQLYYPMGIVINHADEIFITDQCNHRVSIYDPQGNYFASFGERGTGNGKFRFPIGIGLDF